MPSSNPAPKEATQSRLILTLGFGLIVLAIAALCLGAVWGWGEQLGWPGIEQKNEATCWIVGGAFLLWITYAIALGVGAPRVAEWLFRKEAANDAAPAAGSRATPAPDLEGLREHLSSEYGRGWRYRLPWLLLTGDKGAVERLAPGLPEKGWAVLSDVALIWHSPDVEAHEVARLEQLRKLRRRRPLDGVFWVIDKGTDLARPQDATRSAGVTVSRVATLLRWSAPVYLLEGGHPGAMVDAETPTIGLELPRHAPADVVERLLLEFRGKLSDRGVTELIQHPGDCYTATLSAHLDKRAAMLAMLATQLAATKHPKATIAGIAFAPHAPHASPALSALWPILAANARRHPGRRIGLHPVTVFSTVATIAIAICTAGMLVSGFHNARNILDAQQALDTLDFARKPAERLRGLLAVQQQIERYTPGDGGHYMARFGLNRDAAILAALWKPYASASAELLVAPIQQDLEDVLVDLAQVQVAGLNEQASQWALGGHQTLKTYLMLARPERAEPDFLAAQLVQHWQTDARITPGERDDLARRLLTFYAGHVRANPGWRIAARPEIIAGARRTVLAVIGQRNAQDTIYRQVIDEIGDRFPDQTLASLAPGIDTRGLVRANTLVPGAYTRQAYEGHVADAIEQAARRAQITADWVLSDTEAPRPAAPSDLQAALAARYFADYADHWQRS